MSERTRSFWRLINEQPLNPDRMSAGNLSLRRMFCRYFLKPHTASILFIVITGVLGCVAPFFYAWTGRFVADDIVQVQLLAAETQEAAKAETARPGDGRLSASAQPGERTSLAQRHENSTGRSTAEKMRLIAWLGVLLVVVLALNQLRIWLSRERMIHVGQKVQFHMRQRIYAKLHALPMSYHDRNSAGYLMTHLFSDVAGAQQLTLQQLHSIPYNVATMVVGAVIMFSIDVPLACMVLLALPAYMVCYRWFRRRLRTVHVNLRERQGRLNAHIANRITNFYLVKSFVRETFEAIGFLRKGRVIVRDTLAASVLSTSFTIICGIISGVCMVAVLWIGALRMQAGAMTLGTLLLFYASAGYMFSPVASLTGMAGSYHRLCAISRKIMRVLDEPITLADPLEPRSLPDLAPEIRFENVTMSYDDNRPAALKELSFTLAAGASLCVMGPSGSGKTTLAKLACRIYDPTEGAVRLGDVDIAEFRLADLHKFAGFVSQEPVIFDGTIADNIRYGSAGSDPSEMVSAAQYAQIHEFIVRLPERYETLTRERGLTLSGGQKQRVNLARTLLYDPKVLILDDCTSALDAETEAKLVDGFETALRGRTSLLVSHRISIALRCDFVMMLDEGRMVEFGRPEELLKQDGPFAALHKEQTDKTRPHLELKRA